MEKGIEIIMKTKVRITETGFKNGYKHLLIDILNRANPRYDTLDVIGTISFQYSEGNRETFNWYAMKFVVETHNPDHLLKMARLAKHIKDNSSSDAQPEEIKQLLGAEEYFRHHSNFIPVSNVGMRFYKVMVGSACETSIIAPNDIVAEKILAKKKLENAVLVYDHVIER